jgi:hypothetical protein
MDRSQRGIEWDGVCVALTDISLLQPPVNDTSPQFLGQFLVDSVEFRLVQSLDGQ